MSSDTEERLAEDVLFLACTRPAMVGGVPMEAVGLNLIASATVFLAAHSPAWLLIAPVLHVVFKAVCKHDHNAFRVLWMFVDTKGRSRNGATWGGSSATPLPLKRRYSLQEAMRG
ncbi:MAG: type IV secretion system protein VirB3 [Phenylobacterium sp.]|uniref:type IV secretion system protein VirB3 n=1 Tax=Phenylobacterium sp. TaxID=1871053 RepID=UPI0025E7178B|nr:type IV secretion system protein VirB3 [Phenylobacterium sp.]MBI1198938.1 type IV secretion system protein VirB3 [Phenylobacterium sp.]